MKYKIGDTVRIKATNEEGKLTDILSTGVPFWVELPEGVYRFREAELCDPAPVKVGDVLVEGESETKVLEVFENTFLSSEWDDFDKCMYTFYFNEIKARGWKIKGKEDIIVKDGKRYKLID